MASYTIFGSDDPALSASGDDSEVSVATAFYSLGTTGWRIRGIRFFVPVGTTLADGMKGYIWTSNSSTPTTQIAEIDFTDVVAGEWNEQALDSPLAITAGKFYWAQVYFPEGGYGFENSVFSSPRQSVEVASLYGGSEGETNPGNASYVYGPAGSVPASDGLGKWYGVDVTVDDGTDPAGPGAADILSLTDTVTAQRSGLPTVINALGTASDPLGEDTTDALAITVGAETGLRTIRRSPLENRITWGQVVDDTIQGPVFINEGIDKSVGLSFHVQWDCRGVGARIDKAPDCAGDVDVQLWKVAAGNPPFSPDGAPLAEATVTWEADAGGWVEVEFESPADLTPENEYVVSYYSPTGDIAASPWVFNALTHVVPPVYTIPYENPGGGGNTGRGGSANLVAGGPGFPTPRFAHNYYVDPIVEWADKLEDYAALGINTLSKGFLSAEYIAAVKATGMDWYPGVNGEEDPTFLTQQRMVNDPEVAALIKGYYILDEPDIRFPYTPPTTVRNWINNIRKRDSTRPVSIVFSRVVGLNQDFIHQPQGSSMLQAWDLWRQWAAMIDTMDGDFYALGPSRAEGRFGIWIYPAFIRRLGELNDHKTPISAAIDTASQDPGYPIPADVPKAAWATLIAGAKSISYFDIRFADSDVSTSFSAMLSNAPMMAVVSALNEQILGLADALWAPEADLVESVSSSNTTAGPVGGTYGVPIHYTSRQAGGENFLFAQGIRPGATTGTFHVPSAAGKTLTVIDEARTIVVDGSGIFTDTFVADYSVHLYSWTP
jgi:hypothetical protein